MFSMGATAGANYVPSGVPVADQAPLFCTTENYSVVAKPGPNGEFPILTLCGQEQCSLYHYMVSSPTSATISQSILSISADQVIDDVQGTGTNPWVPTNLGEGDSKTGTLDGMMHEYPIRLNASHDTIDARIIIKGITSSKHSTMRVVGGKIDESCLIAGPGVSGNPFETTPLSTDESAVGGKCAARLYKNQKGEVIDIVLYNEDVALTAAYPVLAQQNIDNDCVADQPMPPPGKNFRLAIGGADLNSNPQPLQFTEGEGKRGITFGTGTTTVYLPSGWAICTASPCPGKATYVWY
jgi:hypothetical protein